MIGALLGHQHPETMARYIHLVHDPVQEAAERTGEALLQELTGLGVGPEVGIEHLGSHPWTGLGYRDLLHL
jgi:hypothetical protein